MPYFNVNGIRLFYEVKGNPEGKETVAFFNGVMASTGSWAYQVPVFEKLGYRIILHDFKGQTMSDKPNGEYTFKQHAEEAKLLFDYLGVKKLHTIGTSYGGEVAMRFAIDYPDYTKSISIIDSVSELDETLKLFVSGWKTFASIDDPEGFFWGMAPSIYSNSFIKGNKEFLRTRAVALKNISRDYFKGQISLYNTFEHDLHMTDELSNIKCPALVVVGEEDILKPYKFSKLLADNIQNSEFAVIPGSGHVTIFEKPNILNTMLLGFVIKNS
ncbi:MAG: putative hydrolase or acyltransferase of alpha/beta superfamily [Clostridiales bacterium]|jgi:3-oxoadipate enol-lactonase|nr:putative hydrolase or acyltransferase of alpha/beta superfamily [Clostridiales bacterium]